MSILALGKVLAVGGTIWAYSPGSAAKSVGTITAIGDSNVTVTGLGADPVALEMHDCCDSSWRASTAAVYMEGTTRWMWTPLSA